MKVAANAGEGCSTQGINTLKQTFDVRRESDGKRGGRLPLAPRSNGSATFKGTSGRLRMDASGRASRSGNLISLATGFWWCICTIRWSADSAASTSGSARTEGVCLTVFSTIAPTSRVCAANVDLVGVPDGTTATSTAGASACASVVEQLGRFVAGLFEFSRSSRNRCSMPSSRC